MRLLYEREHKSRREVVISLASQKRGTALSNAYGHLRVCLDTLAKANVDRSISEPLYEALHRAEDAFGEAFRALP